MMVINIMSIVIYGLNFCSFIYSIIQAEGTSTAIVTDEQCRVLQKAQHVLDVS